MKLLITAFVIMFALIACGPHFNMHAKPDYDPNYDPNHGHKQEKQVEQPYIPAK